MKTFFRFLLPVSCLLALPFTGSSQNNTNTFLARYSYPIFVVYNKQQFTGTAFFYRFRDTTFLVSNYHAIKGMSPMKQNINFISDTLYLKYPVKNQPDWKLIPIPTGEDVTGATEIFNIATRIDLLKVPVHLPEDANISFINELIDEEYLDKEPEEIVVFGYPPGNGTVLPFTVRQQQLKGKINPEGFADYDASLKLNFPDISDSAKAIMRGTSRYYYFIKPYAAQGYSGAPVLGKFRNASNQEVYCFIGVIFAGQPATRQTWAIKASVALQYLQGEL